MTKRNKAVILLATIDDKGEIDEATNKPNIILDYNRTKGGVDTVDQMCTTYTTQRNTNRWPLAIFFRILDIAGINSEIAYNSTKPLETPPRRRIFLNDLGLSLIQDHMEERAKISTLPKDIAVFLSRYRTTAATINTVNRSHSGRCHVCSAHKNNKTTVTCDLCHKFACKEHCKKTIQCSTCMHSPMEED